MDGLKFRRIFLYLTGFFCGMSVMAIELAASRLMAPYFSSSQIVYTIIIATVMIAMAIGNIIGGKMADKEKNPRKLFFWIFIAAIWIALIPVLGKYIIAGVALLLAVTNVTTNFLVLAAFISCMLVFVFPLLVLGMVTPNLIKYAVSSLNENGKVVGYIEALNTIGSIIGTFLPTFVTIPYIGTSKTFIIYAAVLLMICIVYAFYEGKRRIAYSSISIFVMILAIFLSRMGGIAFWSNTTIHEDESIYNYLRVEETNRSINLSTNVLFGVQSIKMKGDELTGMYYDYALASNSMINKENTEILILGLGTGTFAYQSMKYYDNVSVDGVEIDEKIVDLAYKYFDLPESVNVYINDGRSFIDNCDKKYDIILVDAYQDITIPFQMSSIEFFQSVKDHLNDDGVMVVNMNMYTSNDGGINDYLSGTIKHCFNNCYGVKANSNYELFACNDFDLKERLNNNIQNIENTKLKTQLEKVYNGLEFIPDNEYILTDDKAPVEILGMNVLDEMISAQLIEFRAKIKGKNLVEIIQMLMNGELF